VQRCLGVVQLAIGLTLSHYAYTAAAGPTPRQADWAALGKLPDWSGAWAPDMADQERQETDNPPPWTQAVQKQVARMLADAVAGHPKGLFINCLPEGMPSWMLISHNVMEILFTPGRVTMLGDSDGNRLRRIATDGRGHSSDPDPTFFGESVGHWEGDTLVVDTVGVLPQSFIATSESVGVPNDGNMHIVERLHLAAADTLGDDLEITAPHVLTHSWKTTRLFHRHRDRPSEIVEGECLEGNFQATTDRDGHAVFVPRAMENGNALPPDH
jgi:hypothetical protein